MTPYILDGRKRLPPESEPGADQFYDAERQLWVDRSTDSPLVELMASPHQSQFGETTITETREGADQREIVGMATSQFGETTMSKSVEGADHEITGLSQFGETTMTRTVEGADQEITGLSQFGETAKTATFEGMDQPEALETPAGGSPSINFKDSDSARVGLTRCS